MDGFETYGQTVIHPVALGFTLLMGVLVLFLPRRFSVVPMILVACFIPLKQRIVVGTLDFDMLRILVLFGWTRVFLRGEYWSFRFNPIDKVLILLVISRMTVYSIQWATHGAFVYQLGQAFNAIGMYFMCRFLIRDLDDTARVFKAIAIISVPLAISMVIEHLTARNAFSVFGGVPAVTAIRQGRLRCQGAFSHPIMAGSFGATLFPLIFSLWWAGGINRGLALIGGIAATIITIVSSSSGPLIAYVSGIAGLCLWPLRQFMRALGWGLLAYLVALQMYMRDPIWSLITHLDIVSGSTADHRYALIDAAIRRFGEWWLGGVKSTAHWGWGLRDVTNQYILEGVQGGLVTLVLFIAVIVLCFRGLGRAITEMAEQSSKRVHLWALGVSLLTTAVSFMGVSYFGQMVMIWYLQLALISTVVSSSIQAHHEDLSNASPQL
jgi:hypothetical protein